MSRRARNQSSSRAAQTSPSSIAWSPRRGRTSTVFESVILSWSVTARDRTLASDGSSRRLGHLDHAVFHDRVEEQWRHRFLAEPVLEPDVEQDQTQFAASTQLLRDGPLERSRFDTGIELAETQV